MPRLRPPRLAALAAALALAALAGCDDAPGHGACALGAAGAPWVAFCSDRGGAFAVEAIRTDGSCRGTLAGGAEDDLYPTWSPDGAALAYLSTRPGLGVYVRDLASGAERPLEVGGLSATGPAWSPDGARIAFEGRAPGALTSDLYLVDAGGGVPVNLTQGTSHNGGPAWAPAGDALYFVSDRGGAYEVYRVAAAGGDAVQVTTGSWIVGRPAPSPDGARLAYARALSSGEAEVVTCTLPACADPAVVTSQNDSEPAWSPDGGQLAIRSYRGGHADLYLVDAVTGAELARLTDDAASVGAAAFRPAPAP